MNDAKYIGLDVHQASNHWPTGAGATCWRGLGTQERKE